VAAHAHAAGAAAAADVVGGDDQIEQRGLDQVVVVAPDDAFLVGVHGALRLARHRFHLFGHREFRHQLQIQRIGAQAHRFRSLGEANAAVDGHLVNAALRRLAGLRLAGLGRRGPAGGREQQQHGAQHKTDCGK